MRYIIQISLVKKILEFDHLSEAARSDFKIDIPELDELTAQQIEKIIKEDYETGSTSAVDSHERDEMTPHAPAKKRGRRPPRKQAHSKDSLRKMHQQRAEKDDNEGSTTEDEI